MPRNVANNFSSLWKSALTSIEILFLFSAICNSSFFLSDTKSCFPHIPDAFEIQKSIDSLIVLGQLLILNSAIFAEILSKKFFPSYTGRFRDLKKSCLYQRFIATFFLTFILFCGNFDIKSYSPHIRHAFDIAKSTDFFRVLRQLFFLTFVLFDGTFVQPKINPLI